MTNGNSAYNRRLERLLEASRLLNSTLEVEELTEIVLHIVQDEVPVDRCTLYVLDRRQNLLRSFVAQGVDKSEITVPVGEGLAGAVAETRQPIDVTDVYEDERFHAEYDDLFRYKTRDVYSIPVFNRAGSLIGVLQLLNRKQPLQDADKEFLAAICTYIGLALQNAWDHHELIEARKLEQELTVVRDRLAEAQKLAHDLANGPTFGNAMTKRMLEMEWAMSVETAIEAEAVAQALCMETEDFARAFRAFAAKQKPVFEGN
jgi:GAF domain-containing protein